MHLLKLPFLNCTGLILLVEPVEWCMGFAESIFELAVEHRRYRVQDGMVDGYSQQQCQKGLHRLKREMSLTRIRCNRRFEYASVDFWFSHIVVWRPIPCVLYFENKQIERLLHPRKSWYGREAFYSMSTDGGSRTDIHRLLQIG